MLGMILRKMRANLWMVLCLLVGSLLAAALVASIPVYTEGILQRLLTKELEQFQLERSTFPGRSVIRRNFYMPDDPDRKLPLFQYLDEEITERLFPALGVPARTRTRLLTVDYLTVYPDGLSPESAGAHKAPFAKLEGMTDLEEHIRLVAGRLAEPGVRDGVIEALVSERALRDLGLYLDATYDLWDTFFSSRRLARVRIVGVFTLADTRDPYWFRSIHEFGESLMIDPEVLRREFIENMTPNFTYGVWYYALDYHTITLAQIPGVTARAKEYQRMAQQLSLIHI